MPYAQRHGALMPIEVSVVFDGLFGDFAGCLEERADVCPSKPKSAKAMATTLAPRSWPSWPSLNNAVISCDPGFPSVQDLPMF